MTGSLISNVYMETSFRLCCGRFSLRLAVSSHLLIYPDKFDLIHRLLSSIYLAASLSLLIDTSGDINYLTVLVNHLIEDGRFTTVWIMSMVYIQGSSDILLHWWCYVCILCVVWFVLSYYFLSC